MFIWWCRLRRRVGGAGTEVSFVASCGAWCFARARGVLSSLAWRVLAVSLVSFAARAPSKLRSSLVILSIASLAISGFRCGALEQYYPQHPVCSNVFVGTEHGRGVLCYDLTAIVASDRSIASSRVVASAKTGVRPCAQGWVKYR